MFFLIGCMCFASENPVFVEKGESISFSGFLLPRNTFELLLSKSQKYEKYLEIEKKYGVSFKLFEEYAKSNISMIKKYEKLYTLKFEQNKILLLKNIKMRTKLVISFVFNIAQLILLTSGVIGIAFLIRERYGY